MIAIVPVHFDGKCGCGHWQRMNIDLHVLGNGGAKAAWDDRDHVGTSDDGREHMKGWHPKRVFPLQLVIPQKLLNARVRHAGAVGDRQLC